MMVPKIRPPVLFVSSYINLLILSSDSISFLFLEIHAFMYERVDFEVLSSANKAVD